MTTNPSSEKEKASCGTRRRDHRQLHGMRNGSNSSLQSQEPTFNHSEDLANSNLQSRSLSDIWEQESKQSDPVAGKKNCRKQNLHQQGEVMSILCPWQHRRNLMVNVSDNLKPNEGNSISKAGQGDEDVSDGPDEEVKSDRESEREDGAAKTYFGLSKISLPPSAASFYSGSGLGARIYDSNPEICRSVGRLNQFLEDGRKELNAGAPGKFLRVVIGQEASDVGSVVSTLLYAFYLHETREINDLCTLPVINMKKADLNMHCELKWLLTSCHVDQSSLVFVDEIDLSYYDLFGTLKVVLLNGLNLPSKQEGLKDAVVEIFNCKQDEFEYSSAEAITMDEGCTCCALIAAKFSETSPETLAGYGFSRLLLAGILLDTANLTTVQCTTKDKYMATLLLKGAGRFGCSGLYQILKYKMFDISDLKVRDILRRDFKKWTRVAGKPNRSGSRLTVSIIGMSTIGISVEQLLTHESSAAQEITLFLNSEKLRLLLVVSGYYDSRKSFKREILVCAETIALMQSFLHFFTVNGKNLPLRPLNLDVGEELRAFEIDDKMTSRRTIERLLEEFSGTLRRTWRILPDAQHISTVNQVEPYMNDIGLEK